MTTDQTPVLVGYDGTEGALSALGWAAHEAAQRGTSLHVLHAAEYALYPGPMGSTPYRADLFETQQQRILEDGRTRAAKIEPNLVVTTESLISAAVGALVTASGRAQLLVVGSHGHTRLGAFVLGSTAYAVTTHAQCPVVVVRGNAVQTPDPGRPVLVAVDGTESALRAVHFAADAASRAGTSLTVLTIYPDPVYPDWVDVLADTGADSSAYDRAMRSEVGLYISSALDGAKVQHPDLAIGELIARGRPAREIVRCAEGFGLIVVGSRGRGAFTGLVLGSVGHGVLSSAPCPVAVVR